MVNETVGLALALAAGFLLGVIFFGGLWWTVQKGLSSKQPALWFFSSMLFRTSIALLGFYYVSGGHWERLLICLFGFVIARRVIMRITQQHLEESNILAKEAKHAT